MNKVLEKQIEQSLKTMEQSKDWNKTYEEQAKELTEKKQLLDQFYKQVKNYEGIQFYLARIFPNLPNIFTVQARKNGQPIATIKIAEDKTTVTTESYNESNKKNYGCDIQLKQHDLNDKETIKFLEFFNKEIKPKGKIDEQSYINSMLLAEFAKTSSATKLLLGIQPIKYANLFYPVPINLNPKEEPSFINVLTRTKVRKLTIIEPLTEASTPESVLESATAKAVFLCKLLHTKQGKDWYKIMGFHGRVTPHLTIKVCIAVPKSLKAKCKEFEPFELKAGTDSIEYHYMTYDTDGAKITKIDTTINS